MATEFFKNIAATVFPDPIWSPEKIQATSYEDVHAEAQAVLLPPLYGKGFSYAGVQVLNDSTALQYRMSLEPGAVKQTMFGPMPGPGNRTFSLGGIFTKYSLNGGVHRFTGQVDVENATAKTTLVSDVWGDNRLRIVGQGYFKKETMSPEWGLTATWRGADYVSVLRAKNDFEFGGSYNQRLAEGSPVVVGGELFVCPQKIGVSRAVDFAFGAMYEANKHKSSLHYATSGSGSSRAVSAHHIYTPSVNTRLAAKCIVATSGSSMASVGYKMKFPNTLTTIHGSVDTYGVLKAMIERHPLPDMKAGMSLEAHIGPQAKDSVSSTAVGFRVTIGSQSPIEAPLSPCTLSRDIFSTA